MTWEYAGKERNMVSIHVTPTQGTILELLQKVEQIGHKVLIDYFSSPKPSTICTRETSVAVVLLTTKRRCHLTSVLTPD
jgi:hypothetical protein